MKRLIKNIKQNYKLTLGVLIIGILLGLIISKSSNQPIAGSTHQHINESAHQHINESENQLWTCSMHPQIKQDKPGLCPICAMELVPMESVSSDDEHVDPNEIQMSKSALALASVQTTIVERGIPEKDIHLLGKVQADERRISELTARFGGRIEQLFINYTGQRIKKGQKLGTIYSPELITAQKELLEAITYKESNPSFYKATRTKLKLWDLTEEQINAIENTGEPKTYFEILSPISGTVTKRHVAIGDYVKEGSAFFEVIDLSKVWIMFDAYESDLPWIKEGDNIEFTIQSVPAKTYSGKVTFIDPFIDAKTRVAKVRVELNNTNRLLKPEMFANGILESNIADNTNELLIPKSSILWTGKRAVVYVKVPDRETASFIYREVVLGPEAGNFYVVSEGLSEGEEIASNGVFKIDAAAQLAGKTSMMNPEGEQISTGHNHGSMDMGGESQQGETMEMDEHENHNQQGEATHAMFKVYGNCGMCKTRIEEAALSLDGVKSANWDENTKMVHLSYNPEKVQEAGIHKAIAKAGHDTEKETAPDDVYNNLPECCLYDRVIKGKAKANVEHIEFNVSGNCGMCKDRIEEAALSLEGVNSADWNEDSKLIQLSINTDKVKEIDIHKAIAKVGHDTEKETAPKEVYENLPECCKYTKE